MKKQNLDKDLYIKIVRYIYRLGTPALNYVAEKFNLDLKTADKYIKAIKKDRKYSKDIEVMCDKFKRKVLDFTTKIIDEVGYKVTTGKVDIPSMLIKYKVPKKYHHFLSGMLSKIEGVHDILAGKK